MTVTRLVIGTSSTGGIVCTIVGNTLTFPAAYGGPSGGSYTTSNFVYNITKDEYKAIKVITPNTDFFNAFSDVTVADIGTWVATDKYALARTQLASPTFTTVPAATAASTQANEEIVVLPSGDTEFGILSIPTWRTLSTFDVVIRGWSPQQKIINVGLSLLIDHEADLTLEDFTLILRDTGLSQLDITTANLTWTLNRISLINPVSNCFHLRGGGHVGSNFTMICNSCIGLSSVFDGAAFVNDVVGATLILHNCIAGGDFPIRSNAGTFKAFNTITHLLTQNRNTGRQWFGTFDAASDFNAAQRSNAAAPGSNSLQNQTLAQIGMAWRNSPAGVDSQYPLDFRTVNSSGSNMKDNGNTFSDSPGFDFNGFKCPTGTGNQRTIGPCNFSTNNGGVAWPGFGLAVPINLGVAAPTIDFHLDERAPLVRQFTLSRTARLPDIEIRVLKKGEAVDLSGASILFSMEDESGTVKVDAAAGVVEDGPKGKVKYQWAAADVDTEGTFFGQMQISVSGKAYRIPNFSSQKLRIVIGPRVN